MTQTPTDEYKKANSFIEVCRGVLLKGVGLETLWSQVLILLVFATVLMALSIRQFRQQLG